MNPRQLPQEVDEAIEWLALERSGSMNEEQRRRFQHWLDASPANRQACDDLRQRLDQMLGGLPQASQQMLSLAGSSRRHLLRGALVIAGIGAGGWWLQRSGMLPPGHNDLRSGLAERRRFELEDGSSLVLNARSRLRLAFDEKLRLLELREGALNVKVASDPQRPLLVRTAFGEIRALGTQFSVSLHDAAAHVWVQESQVRLQALDGTTSTLAAGQGASLASAGILPLDARHAGEGRWQEGILEVHDRPLEDILDFLRPYQRGLLSCSREAAALRVSGIFPLDDTAQALRSLEETLPVRIERHFGWWTRVDLR
ncbi:FecR domain-containing protein [Stutzerimonas kirkiae]|uniref:Iron dicitrate transport regulator FecR n=1 Tax=Stutzerimonas kirkiae TaxID=2211392 RepID=A0A4Q9RCG7_9GAMM|nr:FecR domain-containing protein [Stutzerimonas kirkiae]TBU98850.1 iron dicitrate transport regulator FecR [Stutzerimonas kirkiae]TBV03944.1 iron dicitrate transport regulator FecR [Stutzerimonas kirkiae]TBV09645.1 iron dicitrate transport regulator FecR [Stutzerimonas kirkiae]